MPMSEVSGKVYKKSGNWEPVQTRQRIQWKRQSDGANVTDETWTGADGSYKVTVETDVTHIIYVNGEPANYPTSYRPTQPIELDVKVKRECGLSTVSGKVYKKVLDANGDLVEVTMPQDIEWRRQGINNRWVPVDTGEQTDNVGDYSKRLGRGLHRVYINGVEAHECNDNHGIWRHDHVIVGGPNAIDLRRFRAP